MGEGGDGGGGPPGHHAPAAPMAPTAAKTPGGSGSGSSGLRTAAWAGGQSEPSPPRVAAGEAGAGAAAARRRCTPGYFTSFGGCCAGSLVSPRRGACKPLVAAWASRLAARQCDIVAEAVDCGCTQSVRSICQLMHKKPEEAPPNERWKAGERCRASSAKIGSTLMHHSTPTHL